MFFYIFFLLFITVLVLIGSFFSYRKRVVDIIILIIIVLISGLRKGVGNDYNSYVSWYLNKTRDDDLEYGFVAIMQVFRWFNLNPFFLFFFFSFFTCIFVFAGIKNYTTNSNLALLFYILIPSLYLTSFTLIRQSFSVAVSFYAFYYLINKKYLIYFLLMLLGISIHNTCLIPFILFFLVFKFRDKIKISHLYILIIGSFILSRLDFVALFKEIFVDTRYILYFSNQNMQVDILKIIIINLEGIFFLFFCQKIKNEFPYHKYLLVIYCFSIVFVNLFSMNYDLTRISTYFRIFEIILIAELIFLEINHRKKIFFLVFYVLYFSAFLIGLRKNFEIQNKNLSKFIPYNSILCSYSGVLNGR